MEKNIGDNVYLDGYNTIAQCNSRMCTIEQKEYRFDPISGEKFPIYFTANTWFDGRDGSAYNNEKSMYYLDLTPDDGTPNNQIISDDVYDESPQQLLYRMFNGL